MKKLACFTFAVMLTHSAAVAEKLAQVSSPNNSRWFVEPDSIRQAGERRQAYVVVDHLRKGSLQLRQRFLVSVDCPKSRFNLLNVASYDRTGTLLGQAKIDNNRFAEQVFQPYPGVGAAARRICKPNGSGASLNTQLQSVSLP